MKSFPLKIAGCLLLLTYSGCAFFGLKKQIQTLTDAASLSGTMTSDSQKKSSIAVIVCSENSGGVNKVVRYQLMQRPGAFHFILPPGTYSVGAFEDTNGNFIYDPDETAALLKEPAKITLVPKQNVKALRLTLSHETPDHLGIPVNLSLTAPGPDATRQQLRIGKIITLDDPRFDDSSGEMGLWKFDRFRKEIGGGIFFLEPYDEAKIPVLFVHGYTGTPRDFKRMVAGLDRNKFQPWFAFYPSAARMSIIADNLNAAVTQLQMTYKFESLFVVGYSMGGLISRGFILQNLAEQAVNYIPVFVSIATPWNGHYTADLRHLAPTEVPSWQDLATNSAYIQKIFSCKLPEKTNYFLFFGYEGDRNPLRINNDRFITLESALDPRAQAEAAHIYAFNDSHENILDNVEVSNRLNELFEAESRRNANLMKQVGGEIVGMSKKITAAPATLFRNMSLFGSKADAAEEKNKKP